MELCSLEGDFAKVYFRMLRVRHWVGNCNIQCNTSEFLEALPDIASKLELA